MTPIPQHPSATAVPVRAAVIVAHPDDETLWSGGYILEHPEYLWRIVTLCRATDPDRAPKFQNVLERFGAAGEMADLDDETDQVPLPQKELLDTVVHLAAGISYDLILTHGPDGEYTRHRRHSECCQAVVELWRTGGIFTQRLWTFAYEDGNGTYLPRVRPDADRREILPHNIRQEKLRIMTDLYGFRPDTWEVRTTPGEEGFKCFDSPKDVRLDTAAGHTS